MAVRILPMTRKKRVPEKYNPDSFRVISTQAEDLHVPVKTPVKLPFRDELLREKHTPYLYERDTQVLPKPMPDYRANRPHTDATDFLRRNVLLLNEPICHVHTAETQPEQESWWPSRTSDRKLDAPPYTVNTTFREDFRKHKNTVPAATRHSSNPNQLPSSGAVPVNFLRGTDEKQSLWKEGLSYEHQYNSRLDPSYPIRGKRHGAFVWDKLSPEDAQQFIDHQNLQTEARSQMTTQCPQVCSGPDTANVTWPANTAGEIPPVPTDQHTADKTPETSPQCQTKNVFCQEFDSPTSRRQSVTMGTSENKTTDMPRVDQ